MNEPEPSVTQATASEQDLDNIEDGILEREEAMARRPSTVGRNRAIAERLLLDFRARVKRSDR